jgi:hypothetical protein
VIENEKLACTAALKPGYRPQNPTAALLFTAVILLEPHGAGTRYTAIAIHGDEEGAKKHADIELPRRLGQSPQPTRHAREDDVSGGGAAQLTSRWYEISALAGMS